MRRKADTISLVTIVREPLVRNERILWGVCAAVGNHLGISPWYVRALTLFVPLLIPIYAFLAVVVPRERGGEVHRARLARVQESLTAPWAQRLEVPVLILLLAVGIVIAAGNGGVSAFLLTAFGLAVIWSRPKSASAQSTFVRIGVGAVAVTVGLTVALMNTWFFQIGPYAAFVAVLVLAVLALIAGPAIYRLVRDLTDERLQREREAQRADIAAHLHDSVLQTLGVIRARADDSGEVARLARAQERELRRWLYEDRPEAGESLSDEIEVAAGRVEDTHGGVVEIVVAGDARPGEWSAPLVAALGEACTNAVKHGGGAASVYAEIGAQRVDVWVRDRGPGFDLDAVAPDRVGVRRSILERMERAGGGAELRSPLPDGGTEVHLWLNGM